MPFRSDSSFFLDTTLFNIPYFLIFSIDSAVTTTYNMAFLTKLQRAHTRQHHAEVPTTHFSPPSNNDFVIEMDNLLTCPQACTIAETTQPSAWLDIEKEADTTPAEETLLARMARSKYNKPRHTRQRLTTQPPKSPDTPETATIAAATSADF
jgi:hypothetical protein